MDVVYDVADKEDIQELKEDLTDGNEDTETE